MGVGHSCHAIGFLPADPFALHGRLIGAVNPLVQIRLVNHADIRPDGFKVTELLLIAGIHDAS